jgi:hypothetical protein
MTMMTPDEYTAAAARVSAAKAEIDALEQQMRDCINVSKEHSQKALEYVAMRKAKANQRTKLEEEIAPAVAAINQHNIEVAAEQNKRRQAEAEANAAKAKEQAEAKAKAEAEAKAAEQSALDQANAEIERLKAELAAKG